MGIDRGVRVEHTNQGYVLKFPRDVDPEGNQDYTDVLPSFHAKYGIHRNANLRFSYALADDQSPRACAGSAAGSAETVARGRARYLPRTPRHADYAPVETRDWTKSAIPASMAYWRFCQVTDT